MESGAIVWTQVGIAMSIVFTGIVIWSLVTPVTVTCFVEMKKYAEYDLGAGVSLAIKFKALSPATVDISNNILSNSQYVEKVSRAYYGRRSD